MLEPPAASTSRKVGGAKISWQRRRFGGTEFRPIAEVPQLSATQRGERIVVRS